MTAAPQRTPAPIRVGTAGWSYEDWKGIVYPARMPRGFDRLAVMADLFDANEINTSFYRIPDARQTADWARRVGHNPRFSFTAKLFRGFTHERDAGPSDVSAFLAAMEPLSAAGRLGGVLVQYPFSFRDTPAARAELEKTLSRFDVLPLAVEFRHESWDNDEVARRLSDHAAAFVNIDQPALPGNLPPTNRVTAELAYYRFHGRNAPRWFGSDTSNEERYNYLYAEDELSPWADRIREAARSVAARTGRAAARAGVFVILNNHFRGQAVTNALMLQRRLTGEEKTLPESLREAYPALASFEGRPRSPGQMPLFEKPRR